jgi:hypothetical protein
VARLHKAFLAIAAAIDAGPVDLEGEDWGQVAGFYATYGPLGDPDVHHQPLGERVAWCSLVLSWFHSLTALTKMLQEEDDAGLWQWFESCAPADPDSDEPLNLVKGASVFQSVALDDNRSSISVTITSVGAALEDPGYYLEHPEDEPADEPWPDRQSIDYRREKERLYAFLWQAVVESVERRLAAIPLEPIERDFHSLQQPVVSWGFLARGALDAAFLEWFFDVFAPSKVTVCEYLPCKQPVPEGRTKFCCDKHANAHRQRRSYTKRQR